MTVLSEREFWMHRRSIRKKAADPLLSVASIIAIALAILIIGAAIFDFSGAISRPHPAPLAGFFMLALAE